MRLLREDTAPECDRRSGESRRARYGSPSLFSGYRRRRLPGRRSSDGAGYVDIYDFRTWAVALSVLALSILDAVLTHFEISLGHVEEGNPILYRLLESGGAAAFFGVKASVTALALAVIVLHKEWKVGRIAARACLWSYILLSVYHLFLILPGSLVRSGL